LGDDSKGTIVEALADQATSDRYQDGAAARVTVDAARHHDAVQIPANEPQGGPGVDTAQATDEAIARSAGAARDELSLAADKALRVTGSMLASENDGLDCVVAAVTDRAAEAAGKAYKTLVDGVFGLIDWF
jgi:hypothetical protein